MRAPSLPVLLAKGKTIPEVWEKSLILTWRYGIPMPTEYDKETDMPSKDCTMIMVIRQPQKEPRLHRAFPGGLEDLESYRLEVIEGIKDHWVRPGRWSYTYHKRFVDYEIDGKHIDQFAAVIDRLSAVPHSRRAQAITWNPAIDNNSQDPPCLQRLWFRLIRASNNKLYLNMHSHWRSRDAYKAAFMNIFALTELQKVITERLQEKIGAEILIGQYVDISDSYHIYGAYFKEFEAFLATIKRRSFKERTWTSEFAKPIFEETRQKLLTSASLKSKIK